MKNNWQYLLSVFLAMWMSCSEDADDTDVAPHDGVFTGTDDTGIGTADSATLSGADTGSTSGTNSGTDTIMDSGTHAGTDTDTETGHRMDTGTADTDSTADTYGPPPGDCTGLADFTTCLVITDPDRSYDICIKEACQSPGCGTADCNVPGPYFRLADTGQRACFNGEGVPVSCPELETDNFYGQDAQFGWDADHPEDELRYTRILGTLDEPVVQDNVTGLMWQGCHGGLRGDNCTVADERVPSETMQWSDAITYCDTLEWGGHDDWRLPDEFALQSIVDYSVYTPSADTVTFPATGISYYWSSSSFVGDEGFAWYVDFNTGSMNIFGKGSDHYVRCMRSGPATQASRFVRDTSTLNEPIVMDSATNLVWQGCSAGQHGKECGGTATTMTWQEALAYCARSGWADNNDWRLPNIAELHSIVNNSIYNPMIDADVFAATPGDDYWSSSSYVFYKASAWYGNFYSGLVSCSARELFSSVRCVRSRL